MTDKERIKALEIKVSVLIAKNDRLHNEAEQRFLYLEREILVIKEPCS